MPQSYQTRKTYNVHSLRGRRKRRGGEGVREVEKERNPCFKNRAICIKPTDLLAEFTREFTMSTSQRKLANRINCSRDHPQKRTKCVTRSLLVSSS